MNPDNVINIFQERIPYLRNYEVNKEEHDGLMTIEFTNEKDFNDVQAYLGMKEDDSGYVHLDRLSLESKLVLNLYDSGKEDEKHLLFKMEHSVPEFKVKNDEMKFDSIQKNMEFENLLDSKFSHEGSITNIIEGDLKTSKRVDHMVHHFNKVLYKMDEFAENNLNVQFP